MPNNMNNFMNFSYNNLNSNLMNNDSLNINMNNFMIIKI